MKNNVGLKTSISILMVQAPYISVNPSLKHSLYGQQYRKKAVENWDGTGELVGFGRKAACFLVAIFYD